MGKNKKKKQRTQEESKANETDKPKEEPATIDWMSVLSQKIQEDQEQKSYGREILLEKKNEMQQAIKKAKSVARNEEIQTQEKLEQLMDLAKEAIQMSYEEARELAAAQKAFGFVQRQKEAALAERAKQEETTKRYELQCRDTKEHNQLLKDHIKKLKEQEAENQRKLEKEINDQLEEIRKKIEDSYKIEDNSNELQEKYLSLEKQYRQIEESLSKRSAEAALMKSNLEDELKSKFQIKGDAMNEKQQELDKRREELTIVREQLQEKIGHYQERFDEFRVRSEESGTKYSFYKKSIEKTVKDVKKLKQEELRIAKNKKSAQEEVLKAQADIHALKNKIGVLSKLEVSLQAKKA